MIQIGDILTGKLSMNAGGSAYLVSHDLPKDIYIHRNNTNKALHLDTVSIKVVKGKGRAIEGQVLEIVERFRTKFVGTLQVSDKHAFLISDSNKMPYDIFIPLSKLNGGTDGQKAVALLTEWKPKAKSPNGEIVEVLGNAGENDVEIHSILHEYGLPYDFPEDVLAESEGIPLEIPQSEIDKRRDMRDVLTFTIDPVDAKDFDDALSVEWVNGELFVGVHIADVSHYIRPDTDLDKEAYERGTSVYLVDRVVPMLPERLSNGVCSLRPHEDKLCFSAVFKLDKDGNVLEEWFGRTVINSNHRYSYEDAQEIIEAVNSVEAQKECHKKMLESVDSTTATKLAQAIISLNKLAKNMRQARVKVGSMLLEKNEIRFKLDENNKPIDVVFKMVKDSNKLIEEFMLLANKRVALFANSKALPMVNRIHENPDPAKLEALKEFIKQFGYDDIKLGDEKEIRKALNKLLLDVQGRVEANMIENIVVRTMQKAVYSTKLIGHYGLGFKDYAHFTSPIRRYPDIIVHRLMGLYLDGKTNVRIDKLEGKCNHLSERERKAQKAERDSIKYKQCEYMADRIGKVFEGIISSVTDYGVFVTITENGCEGLVRLCDVSGDTYLSDTSNHCLKGYNTGQTIRLGDEVHIVVKSVDIERKTIDFSLIKL